MADIKTQLLKALSLAEAGQWEAAHGLVQQFETDATAAWLHAVLHKIEGDESNSGYWYRRAAKWEHFGHKPQAELAAIRGQLEGSGASLAAE